MKIKPVVLDKIETRHTNYIIDLQLDSNVTFIAGDSGTGKSAVFSFLKEYASENKNIRCFNYLDQKIGYKATIKNSKGKLFVIDNADLLLDDNMRRWIVMDPNNQYIIIGRNPTGLMLTQDDMYEMSNRKEGDVTVFALKKEFE